MNGLLKNNSLCSREFYFIVFFAIFFISHICVANDTVEQNEFQYGTEIPTDGWQEITAPSQKQDIYRLLIDQTQSNYSKIRTWQGSYRVNAKELFSEQSLQEFSSKLEPQNASSAWLETMFLFKFVIEMEKNKVYRSKETDELGWKNTQSNQQFTIPDAILTDERSITTSEHLIQFDPKTVWPEFTFLTGHPEAMKKKRRFGKNWMSNRIAISVT